MNAVAPTPPVTVRHAELTLKPGELRRRLEIKLGITRLTITLSLVDSQGYLTMVAYASQTLPECRLEGNALWIGSTAFDLTKAEAIRVRDTFGPHGLTMVLT